MKPRQAVLNYMEVAVWASQPHGEADVARLMNDTEIALVRMLDGTADDQHVRRLGTDINIGWIRAEQLAPQLANPEEVQGAFERAGAALEESKRIRAAHGRYGLTGPGRQALQDGVDAFEVILRASSPREMHHAEEVLAASIQAAEAKERSST